MVKVKVGQYFRVSKQTSGLFITQIYPPSRSVSSCSNFWQNHQIETRQERETAKDYSWDIEEHFGKRWDDIVWTAKRRWCSNSALQRLFKTRLLRWEDAHTKLLFESLTVAVPWSVVRGASCCFFSRYLQCGEVRRALKPSCQQPGHPRLRWSAERFAKHELYCLFFHRSALDHVSLHLMKAHALVPSGNR